jgi:uncharacterized lipoprotein YajG
MKYLMKKLAIVIAASAFLLTGCAGPKLESLQFRNLDPLPLREPEYINPEKKTPK